MVDVNMKKYIDRVKKKELLEYSGKITKVTGLTIESAGPMASVGELCYIYPFNNEEPVMAEVVGFRDDKILLMPFSELEGIGPGSSIVASGHSLRVNVGQGMIGRVVDGLGNPMDGKGPLKTDEYYPVSNAPPNPLERKNIEDVLPLGIKSIDGLLTCGKGQRVGIFAGSGVGKSTLMGMIARNAEAEINVIGLIGERGREVNEFIENDLKQEGLERSVLVVATSDQPALVRMKAAMLTTSIAEYFRDQGKNVILLMDSLTRFAMAQREIGLAIGEPPVTRGYTPSVFSIFPKLLERAGASDKGTITGLYTVLVDGDDMNEPITDTVRGILDGHIVLNRDLANQNHYPAIDVLQSISRVMSNIVDDDHKSAANEVKDLMATYKESEDLINIGAYTKGTNEKIDESIEKIDKINDFLTQNVSEEYSFEETVEILKSLVLDQEEKTEE